MNALFLICALSLPATHYHLEITDDDRARIEEIRKIREFINKVHPGAGIVIVPPGSQDDELLRDSGLERLPFTYRGDQIYIRRKPVSDKPMKGAS